jgi:hypothetical protein
MSSRRSTMKGKIMLKNLIDLKSCFIRTMLTIFLSLPIVCDAEVFLQGNYVEIGIHDAGSFGTSGEQPEGFHGNIGNKLGFVADYGRDGWDVGDPEYSGDFFLPGTPEEGWMVEWTDASEVEKQFHNFGAENEFDVPQTSHTNTSSGSILSAVWEGTATSGNEQLKIIQTVSFDAEDLFFVMNVVMTNVGTEMLSSLEYMRNVDPDQEKPWTGNYKTLNWVEAQPLRPASGSRTALDARPVGNTDRALTIAEGLTHGLTLGLGTIDSRAVVAASHGFSNRDTDDILDNPTQPFPHAPDEDDSAIVLVYDLGDLAPGQSVSIDYAYILNADDLYVAMGALAAVTILQPTGTVSGSKVIFQATTDDVPNTTRIEFFVNGTSVGVDTSPDSGDVFETTFNSYIFPNEPVSLKAEATFTNSTKISKTATVTVDNAGSSISFFKPTSEESFIGDNISIEISVDDPSHPPVRVSFFRETLSTGSTFLNEDTEAPFTSSFGVDDLVVGETVVIKAVATDAGNRTTTIQVSNGANVLNLQTGNVLIKPEVLSIDAGIFGVILQFPDPYSALNIIAATTDYSNSDRTTIKFDFKQKKAIIKFQLKDGVTSDDIAPDGIKVEGTFTYGDQILQFVGEDAITAVN